MLSDDEESAAKLAKAFRNHPHEAMDRLWRVFIITFGTGCILGLLVGMVVVFGWMTRT